MEIIEDKRHGSNELVIAKQEAEVITTGIAFQEKAILVKKNEIDKIESKPFGSELTTGLHKSIIQDSDTLKRLKKHLKDKNTLIEKLQIN
tara:strand:- start:267 stop:536 length:270 start_codon:yes stop_codon:yes gene_type:complete